MENERTENSFYFDLKHVHKHGCAKFQPNPLFCSQQTATESVAEGKKKEHNKSEQAHRRSYQGTGCRKDPLLCVQRVKTLIYPSQTELQVSDCSRIHRDMTFSHLETSNRYGFF